MLNETLKKIVEENSTRIAATNPFVVAVNQGTIEKAQVITYLYNLKYIFTQTCVMLERGIKRANELGETSLAAFYREKQLEEMGHDQWAKNDLKNQGVSVSEKTETEADEKLNPSTKKLMKYTQDAIQEHPVFYLGYMTFVEYFTVRVGPDFLVNLETKCGIPPKNMTAISNHVEADKHHSEENLRVVSQFMTDPALGPPFFEHLAKFITLVETILADCLGESFQYEFREPQADLSIT